MLNEEYIKTIDMLNRKRDIIRTDPVEKTLKYKKIRKELEKELSELMKDRTGIGSCHIYWAYKKRLLREKYGIDWRSPAELNPGTLFD